jgi:hypothetical protein
MPRKLAQGPEPPFERAAQQHLHEVVRPLELVLAGVELDTGRWRIAAVALGEAVRLARETGNSADHGLALGSPGSRPQRGDADACSAHADEALELAGRLGSGSRLDRAAASAPAGMREAKSAGSLSRALSALAD